MRQCERSGSQQRRGGVVARRLHLERTMETMMQRGFNKLAAYAREHGCQADIVDAGVRVRLAWYNPTTREHGHDVETVTTWSALRNALGY
jgi:predicted Zn-dependent protease